MGVARGPDDDALEAPEPQADLRHETLARQVIDQNAALVERGLSAERNQEDMLAMLVAGVEDHAILMLDLSGRVVTWNAGAERIKGYRAADIIGRHFSVFYSREDVAAGKPASELMIAAREGRLEDEGWRIRQDGTRFWANVVITPLRDAHGILRGYGKITRDLTRRRVAEMTLRASEERFRLMIEGVEDYAIFMLDVAGNVASWNAGAQRFKGYLAEEIIGRHFSVFYPPEDILAGKPERELETAAAVGRLEDEGWRIRNDGTRFWANVVITALRDSEGVLRGYGKITRDLTERRATELELRASEERFRLMVEGVEDYAIFMLDDRGNVASWNAGAQRFKGYRSDEIIGRHASLFYPAQDVADRMPERDLAIAAEQGRLQLEGWRVRQDGTRFWAHVVITALRGAGGVMRGYSTIVRDLTERVGYEQRLEHMADHDPLTGVANRRTFTRELNGHVARVARYGAAGAVLMLDLDNFKYLNDTQGHSAGDRLIVRIAQSLQSRLRDSDIFARIGGDEFAVLLPSADEPATQIVAEALLQAVRDEAMSPTVGGLQRQVTASVGIAMFDDDEGLTADELMVNADLAMYDAKEAGGNRASRYRSDDRERPKIANRMNWAERITGALAHDGFVLLAQPIIPFAAGTTSQYELLLRMREPDGTLISPSSFLNVAEDLRMIGSIDRWVTMRAIDMLAEQRAHGHDLTFEVNLSGYTMGDEELLALIEQRLRETGVPPNRLIFEVTETAAVFHIGRAARFAERLSQLGCGFALDDVGAGFGCFYYIKHLPFDYLKIDGEFVQHCDQNETDRILISAVVHIARGMGMRTIAEYVTNEEVADVLLGLGVDYGQGFHLGRPGPLVEQLHVKRGRRRRSLSV